MASTSKVAQVNLKKLKPYGDIMDDGTVQLCFTLPVEISPEAREAAIQLAQKMGLDPVKVATMEKVADGFSTFVIYGNLKHTIDFTQISVVKITADKRSREEIDDLIREKVGRKLVVLGACTGYDAHTVGIDAIINMKGFAGDYGLERYQWLDARNLGAQVLNDDLIRLAIEHQADAVLVSKVVSQHNIHIKDMKDLMTRAAKAGLTEKLIFVAGGPRVTHPMALECGFDEGFSVGTKPSEVASYIVEEFLRRRDQAAKRGGRVPTAKAELGSKPGAPVKPRRPTKPRSRAKPRASVSKRSSRRDGAKARGAK